MANQLYIELVGDPSSRVIGSIIDGVFQGQIKTSDGDHFYVEKAEYHKQSLSSEDKAHSIMYRRSDVNLKKFDDDRRNKRSAAGGHSPFCGVSITQIAQWMNNVQHSAQETSRVGGTPYSHWSAWYR